MFFFTTLGTHHNAELQLQSDLNLVWQSYKFSDYMWFIYIFSVYNFL